MHSVIHPHRLFAQGQNYALVLLNREIKFDADFFIKIWNNASVRHLVDGGTNHFFNFLDKLPESIKKIVKPADLASGDFDSATKESLTRLKESTCKIVVTEDQDETDFTKALRVLKEHLRTQPNGLLETRHVLCMCEFSGRLDHVFANLNTLHKNVFLQDLTSDPPTETEINKAKATVFIMSSETLSWLLPANLKSQIVFEKEVPNITCGVIPLMGPTKYSSSGLKWDLSPDLVCRFNGLISTSNLVVGKILEITPLDNHSIFCLEFNQKDYIIHE